MLKQHYSLPISCSLHVALVNMVWSDLCKKKMKIQFGWQSDTQLLQEGGLENANGMLHQDYACTPSAFFVRQQTEEHTCLS